MKALSFGLLALCLLTAAACAQPDTPEVVAAPEEDRAVHSLLGTPLVAAAPPEQLSVAVVAELEGALSRTGALSLESQPGS
jgi:hypothetical protein